MFTAVGQETLPEPTFEVPNTNMAETGSLKKTHPIGQVLPGLEPSPPLLARIEVAGDIKALNCLICARHQFQLDLQQVGVYASVKEKGRSNEAINRCTTPGNMLLFVRPCGMASGDASSGMTLARIEFAVTQTFRG